MLIWVTLIAVFVVLGVVIWRVEIWRRKQKRSLPILVPEKKVLASLPPEKQKEWDGAIGRFMKMLSEKLRLTFTPPSGHECNPINQPDSLRWMFTANCPQNHSWWCRLIFLLYLRSDGGSVVCEKIEINFVQGGATHRVSSLYLTRSVKNRDHIQLLFAYTNAFGPENLAGKFDEILKKVTAAIEWWDPVILGPIAHPPVFSRTTGKTHQEPPKPKPAEDSTSTPPVSVTAKPATAETAES